MTNFNCLCCFCKILISIFCHKIPETSKETTNAIYTSVIPLCIHFRWSYKKFIHS